jgi:DNA modification methylase
MPSVKQKRKKPEPQGGLGGGTAWRSKIVGHDRVAPDQLVANPLNYRKHPQAQRDALKAAIEEVGFIRSVTVNKRTGNLIDGHERVWQALTSEQPLIDVEYVDLSEEEEKLALATMDPISEMATMDGQILDQLLRDVNTGSEHLQQLLSDMATDAGILDGLTAGEVVEDEVPPPPVDPITKPGDLWILGEHRLLCGDSTSAKDVERLMDGARADLCFTSPPYGQQRDYTKEGKAKVADWDGLMQGVFANLPMAEAGQVLVNLGLIHREGEWIPYWEGWIEWMREQGWRRFGWYVWDQQRGLPGDWNGRFAPSHEFIFHFNRDAMRPLKHIECNKKRAEREKAQVARGAVKTGLRSKSGAVCELTSPDSVGQSHKVPDSVWRFERHMANDIARLNHPATYPVTLPAHAMKSWPGLAYEPFSGSGTTIIAAEQLHRKCYAMEISPQYCDVAVQRWEKLTGKEATRA